MTDFERGRQAGLKQASTYLADACRPLLGIGLMAGLSDNPEGQELVGGIVESLSEMAAEIIQIPPETA